MGDLAPHRFGPAVITTPPTCTQPGVRTRTCSVCHVFETETIPAQCNLNITLNGNVISGTCRDCGTTQGPVTLDFTGPAGDRINAPARAFGTGAFYLVGPQGFAPSYQVKSNDVFHLTLLFRMTDVETPITLSEVYATTYTNLGNRTNSNLAANYHTHFSWPVNQDGYYAYTMSRHVMSWNANGNFFGGIDFFAFNHPSSTKGSSVNANANAAMQLVGIYDGTLEYNVVFFSHTGQPIDWQSGRYRSHDESINTWRNQLFHVRCIDRLFMGDVPTKPNCTAYRYTFAGWVDAHGQPISVVVGDVFAYPSFTATPLNLPPDCALCNDSGAYCTACNPSNCPVNPNAACQCPPSPPVCPHCDDYSCTCPATPPPGRTIFSTRWPATWFNWLLFFLGFGWIWMWF
jgi:hypothetical protein